MGTIRSDVSLSTIIRVMERMLTKNNHATSRQKNTVDSGLLWTAEKAFNNKTCDFMIDSASGRPFTVDANTVIEAPTTTTDGILKPSLLQRDPSRNEKLTTADFLQPTSLVTSNHENKIYGFYYLV